MSVKKIEALYAWVATDPDGQEGVIAANLDGMAMPLVGGDMDRMKSLREFAEAARRKTGYPVSLMRYGRREDLEELP